LLDAAIAARAMEDVPALIVLKDKTPVAIGTSQFVYEHPDDPKLLVKVLKRGKLQKSYDRKIGGRIGFKRRHGLYVTWMREIEHYFSVTIRLGYRPSFFQEYRGVVDTDLGLGMVVGKETDRSGNLAPTLQTLVRSGRFTPKIRQEFQELLDQINELRISTTDINMNNIVCAWDETNGDHLVLIEGIGVNTFIPLAKFSNYLNVRSNNRHFAKTLRLLEAVEREQLSKRS
jgi:hypothetical protein